MACSRVFLWVGLASLFCWRATALAGVMSFDTNQSPARVVGQKAMYRTGENGTAGGIGPYSLNGPGGAVVAGSKLILCDTDNHRVLIYDQVPGSNDAAADVVVGQPTMHAGAANQGGAAASNTLNAPTAVYSDGTKLIVSDTGNNRVLIFNRIPTANNAAADVVVGQADFTGSACNQGGGADSFTLCGPYGLASNGTNLLIADLGNHRVLLFDSIPAVDNAAADVAMGQPDMTSIAANRGGGPGAATLYQPKGVAVSGGKVFVADMSNHRVLIFDAIPAVDGAGADWVLGQPDKTSNNANQGASTAANTLSGPSAVFSVGGKLLVADTGNHRVLVFNAIPASDDPSADAAAGQLNLTSGGGNQAGSVGEKTLFGPSAAQSDGTKLLVCDTSNHRLLIYNAIPAAAGPSADVVVGHLAMNLNSSNQGERGPVSAAGLRAPLGVGVMGGRPVIADSWNNRVLVFPATLSADGPAAEVVIGQADKTGMAANQGGGPAANTLSFPAGVHSDGTRLFIADFLNNRVLIYGTLPSADNSAASAVVGQLDKVSNAANQGGAAGARTLRSPTAAYSDGSRLIVADKDNHRVLIYNSIPTADGAAADVVVGQPDKTSSSADQGGTVSANGLNGPPMALTAGSKLIVSDTANNRVLIFNQVPTSDNAAADVVLGQPDMVSNGANRGRAAPGADTMSGPAGLFSDGTKLYVADYSNHRVLVFNSVPTSNGAPADVVLGQPDMASASASLLNTPTWVFMDSSRLFVLDSGHHRVLVFHPKSTVDTVSAAGGTMTFGLPAGEARFTVPAGAFSGQVSVSVSSASSFSCSQSGAANLSGTGTGMEVTLTPVSQPSRDVLVSMPYFNEDVAGKSVPRLVLARCDAERGAWVPLSSSVDAANNAVAGLTSHFSGFSIMEARPASGLGSVKVFPNPFQPSRGQTSATFADLPAGAVLKIYALSGEFVAALTADASGLARWDGKNDLGRKVASGLYLAVVSSEGKARTVRLGVEQ